MDENIIWPPTMETKYKSRQTRSRKWLEWYEESHRPGYYLQNLGFVFGPNCTLSSYP